MNPCVNFILISILFNFFCEQFSAKTETSEKERKMSENIYAFYIITLFMLFMPQRFQLAFLSSTFASQSKFLRKKISQIIQRGGRKNWKTQANRKNRKIFNHKREAEGKIAFRLNL